MPKVSQSIQNRINEIMAMRSPLGATIYILLFTLIALGTPIATEEPFVAATLFTLLLVFGILRFWSCVGIVKPELLKLAVFLNSLTWGAFCFLVLWKYHFSSTSLALLLATTGITSGTILTFTHSFRLSVIQLCNMLIPVILGLLAGGGKEGVLSSALATVYLAYMVLQAKTVSKVFIEDLEKSEIISSQKNELELALREAMSAAETKNDFLSMISHEIRTPLNGVIGLAEVLSKEEELHKKHKNMITIIGECGKSLMAIINDVLDFSKIESMKMELESADFDIIACIHSSAKIFENAAQKKKLGLAVMVDPEIPRFIRGDMNRVRQILVNLLGNAIKFTDQGHVALKVHAVKKSLTEVDVHFSVTDSGVGIAENDLPKLFQMFSQVDTSMARRFGGTGLGLAICKKLCILMEGSIDVVSEKGKGSTFSFQIPFKLVEAKNSTLSKQLEATSDDHHYERLKSLRILVGEDNQVNRTVLLAFLAKIGDFKVDVKTTGLEVFEAAQNSHYDLIFMDCQMPVMDGYEATRRIRSVEAFSRIPIIALTANALEGDREKCLEAGMDDYISKPFQSSELSKALEKWLRQALESKSTA